jgi:glycosyltransferase involved in cell wall biosynthesis
MKNNLPPTNSKNNKHSREINEETIGNFPLVSIIVPCRNEEKFIGNCLDSFLNQSFPREKTEILVVEGRSEDKSLEIIKSYCQKYPFIKQLDNPKKIFPAAVNVGVKNSRGKFIMIAGAHAFYPRDYVKECVEYLMRNKEIDNVGGLLKAVPSENTFIAKAIALSLGGRFGKGKEEKDNEIKEVDTVFGGCYRKEVFERIGFFNENLVGSSDMDFNLRLRKKGGKIIMLPYLHIYYYPKNTLWRFFLHNIRDGIWAILPLKYGVFLKLRHFLPLFFILTLPLSIWLYLLLSFYFSVKIAWREKDIRYFFVMPIVFATRHFGYGLGSLFGLIKLIF